MQPIYTALLATGTACALELRSNDNMVLADHKTSGSLLGTQSYHVIITAQRHVDLVYFHYRGYPRGGTRVGGVPGG